MKLNLWHWLLLALWWPALTASAQTLSDSAYIRENYQKTEHQVPMRDGTKLFTVVYAPKDKSQKYPIMLNRTPYSVAPYGEDKYKTSMGPSTDMLREGYIFAYQDVRGKYMSEGEFVNMAPLKAKKGKKDIDESTDTYDAIAWLVKNVPNNNGRVGQWGISYPGYYTSVGLVGSHPALKASSPQAPVTDWFWDDFHHHGAFFLPHAFNFLASFGQPRPQPSPTGGPRFNHGTPDGYDFFLRLGPLSNANDLYLKNNVSFWNDIVQHPNYDFFWQAMDIRPHLKNIKPAVMTVGGWFDAENLFGALETYKTIEKNNPNTYNTIVMGPWFHGGWSRSAGENLGKVSFRQNTSEFYRPNIEAKFFRHYLKGTGKGTPGLPEAYMFNTGANQWREFAAWPPKNTQERMLYFGANGKLNFEQPAAGGTGFDEFISDPAKPVPFSEETTTGMTREYMTDDQRFASRRPDVLVYQTDVLTDDITLAGEILSALNISTTGSDADWVVKLIDVYPDTARQNAHNPANVKMGGYQQMVRSEVMRGRFRNSYEKPEPFTPNQVTPVNVPLQDVLHTFKKGHRIMVQVQSTWFPLVDRNPQKYVPNIYEAKAEDYQKATHRVYHTPQQPSYLKVKVL
ncbi:CocE/NonD family hydrolase [Rufibacter glacialis]|uniref:CocE/NonD family hydrolase n=1 Tax=Rufibacter glacialis TaxID=1259555 RepID=A0A5M8QLM3_9BACT|nr:CocE/NonD family hydrolase [Rufibacter glacialis]KAA6435864.1 CocE/NonD family hydrolase [Rufibacter glacialis]GGK67218.1 glutaryl-7-ACA acylase [Rufibacter glacialis]